MSYRTIVCPFCGRTAEIADRDPLIKMGRPQRAEPGDFIGIHTDPARPGHLCDAVGQRVYPERA